MHASSPPQSFVVGRRGRSLGQIDHRRDRLFIGVYAGLWWGAPQPSQSCFAAAHNTARIDSVFNREAGATFGAEQDANKRSTAGDKRTTAMVHLAAKAHFGKAQFGRLHADKLHLDRVTLARVNSAMMLGTLGSGLVACAVGAMIFDVGRLFSAW